MLLNIYACVLSSICVFLVSAMCAQVIFHYVWAFNNKQSVLDTMIIINLWPNLSVLWLSTAAYRHLLDFIIWCLQRVSCYVYQQFTKEFLWVLSHLSCFKRFCVILEWKVQYITFTDAFICDFFQIHMDIILTGLQKEQVNYSTTW